MEISPCLNWATQFLTVTYDGACSCNVSVKMARISFGALPCKKKNLTARISMLLKLRASPDTLPFSLCNRKRLAIWHMNRPLFPTTLSIPSYDIGKYVRLRTNWHPLVLLLPLSPPPPYLKSFFSLISSTLKPLTTFRFDECFSASTFRHMTTFGPLFVSQLQFSSSGI